MAILKNLAKKTLRGAMTALPVSPIARLLARNRLLPQSIWSRIPADGIFDLHLPNGKTIKYETVFSDGIGRGFYFDGIESWDGRYVADVFLNRLIDHATHFADLGANIGVYSLFAAASNPELRITSFEPVPSTCKHFERLITLNNFGDRIDLNMAAVSDTPGTLPFHLPTEGGEFPVMASLNPEGKRQMKGNLIDVPVVTLDQKMADDPPDLVKMDVQGFESSVLRGMSQILTEHQPVLIVASVYDDPIEEVESELEKFDYTLWHLGPDGPRKVQSIRDATEPKHYYFALTPPDKDHLLEP